MQILVDSTVWIDYFAGVATPQTDHLDSLLGKSPILVADLILAEVLQGIPDERNRKLAQNALLKFWLVEIGGFGLAAKSAVNYQTLRTRGISVRASECLIATYCLENGLALLHSGPGFEAFERHLGMAVPKVGR